MRGGAGGHRGQAAAAHDPGGDGPKKYTANSKLELSMSPEIGNIRTTGVWFKEWGATGSDPEVKDESVNGKGKLVERFKETECDRKEISSEKDRKLISQYVVKKVMKIRRSKMRRLRNRL